MCTWKLGNFDVKNFAWTGPQPVHIWDDKNQFSPRPSTSPASPHPKALRRVVHIEMQQIATVDAHVDGVPDPSLTLSLHKSTLQKGNSKFRLVAIIAGRTLA
jgi:hypothetical protein